MCILIRSLARRRGVSLMIVGMLALAIGANTAIYSVVKAVILTPLPFPYPDQVVHLFEGGERDYYVAGRENSFISVRAGTFQDWREQCRSFKSMAAARMGQAILGGDQAAVVDSLSAGDGFFETLAAAPEFGRYFDAGDYAADGARVVVLSHRLWVEHYNADPSIIGRDVTIDGAAQRVIGVMPAGFYPSRWSDPQLWKPLRWNPETKNSRVLWGHIVYARVRDGVALSEAQAEMDLVTSHIRAAHPDDYDRMTALVAPVAGYTFGHQERLFWLLLGAVALVLLIACANIANLMLARSLERSREFSVRAALGASRAAIVRLVLGESLVLAAIGGVLGVVVSPMLIRPTLALLPAASRIPRLDQVRVDNEVLLYTLTLSMLAGLLFGIAPGLQAARGDLSLGMREGGRGSSVGRHERRLTDALVVSEVALSLVLLVGAGLLVQAFFKLLHDDPGFRPAQVVAAQLSVPDYRFGAYEVGGRNVSRRQIYERLERGISSAPGIEAVGVTASLPLRHGPNPWGISIEGRDAPSDQASGGAVSHRSGLPKHGSVSTQRVTPGYFAALGIPLVRGRLFDEHDRPDAPLVALINETAARKFFANGDPIGKRITLDMTSYFPKATIIGVVGDSRMNGMDREIYPQVFWPMAHLPSVSAWLVVRANGAPESMADTVRRAARSVDPDLTIVELAT
jgi:putative ABC transport system permease protein